MDWKDVLAHAIASCFIGAIGFVLFGQVSVEFVVPVIGAWLWREIEQDINKGHTVVWPIRRSSQKDAEAAAAIVPIVFLGVLL